MSPEPPLSVECVSRKRAFRSHDSAMRYARMTVAKRQIQLTVYRCPHCHLWHISGSQYHDVGTQEKRDAEKAQANRDWQAEWQAACQEYVRGAGGNEPVPGRAKVRGTARGFLGRGRRHRDRDA